jgi:uncharacterized membrane protein
MRGVRRIAFFSFVLTFMFASLFWYLHHVMLNYVKEFKPRLVVLNLGFLMFISLLPFTVGLLGHFIQSPLAQTIYFGNYFVIGLFLRLQWAAAKSLGLMDDPDSSAARAFGVRLAAIPIGAACGSLVAWVSPILSFYAFLFVIVISRLYTKRMEKRESVTST